MILRLDAKRWNPEQARGGKKQSKRTIPSSDDFPVHLHHNVYIGMHILFSTLQGHLPTTKCESVPISMAPPSYQPPLPFRILGPALSNSVFRKNKQKKTTPPQNGNWDFYIKTLNFMTLTTNPNEPGQPV